MKIQGIEIDNYSIPQLIIMCERASETVYDEIYMVSHDLSKLKRDNFIIDENKSVIWNKQEKQKRKEVLENTLNRLKIEECYAPVIEKIKNEIKDYGFNNVQTNVIYCKAYEGSHSNGYYDVYVTAMELCKFVWDVVSAYKI